MHFQRLRLSGFKSFVDPTEFRIEPGVTGIVGPNGCGKSNLLEALRWVMGESSARSLRVAAGGAGMDDVIFAGTAKRPSRDLAEVRLMLDNKARRAPAEFNADEEIEHLVSTCKRVLEAGVDNIPRSTDIRIRAAALNGDYFACTCCY